MSRKKIYVSWVLMLVATTIFVTPAIAKSTQQTVKGPAGQVLTVSAIEVRNGQVLTVIGDKYNKKVGIYLAFCVVGAKGAMPGPCGGGVNTGGSATSSVWISSNPPAYGKSLAVPFSKSGGFNQSLTVSRYIGDVDCAVVKCAVVTRADHTKSTYRKADVIIPMKFKK